MSGPFGVSPVATISHKNVPDELGNRLKLAALHAKKSVRDYTLDALTAAVSRDLDDGPALDLAAKKTVARAAAPVVPASSLPVPERRIEYEE
jgi:plasmid stability protein